MSLNRPEIPNEESNINSIGYRVPEVELQGISDNFHRLIEENSSEVNSASQMTADEKKSGEEISANNVDNSVPFVDSQAVADKFHRLIEEISSEINSAPDNTADEKISSENILPKTPTKDLSEKLEIKSNLLSVFLNNDSSVPAQATVTTLPNQDLALAYYEEDINNRGIYLFDGTSYLQKTFIAQPNALFMQLLVSSSGTLVSYSVDINTHAIKLQQWDMQNMQPFSVLTIPRFDHYLPAIEPEPRKLGEFNGVPQMGELKNNGQVAKATHIQVLPNNVLQCHSISEKIVFFVDLNKNAILSYPRYEYGKNPYLLKKKLYERFISLPKYDSNHDFIAAVHFEKLFQISNDMEIQAINLDNNTVLLTEDEVPLGNCEIQSPDVFVKIKHGKEKDVEQDTMKETSIIKFSKIMTGKNELYLQKISSTKINIPNLNSVSVLPNDMCLLTDGNTNLYVCDPAEEKISVERLISAKDKYVTTQVVILNEKLIVNTQHIENFTHALFVYHFGNLKSLFPFQPKDSANPPASLAFQFSGEKISTYGERRDSDAYIDHDSIMLTGPVYSYHEDGFGKHTSNNVTLSYTGGNSAMDNLRLYIDGKRVTKTDSRFVAIEEHLPEKNNFCFNLFKPALKPKVAANVPHTFTAEEERLYAQFKDRKFKCEDKYVPPKFLPPKHKR